MYLKTKNSLLNHGALVGLNERFSFFTAVFQVSQFPGSLYDKVVQFFTVLVGAKPDLRRSGFAVCGIINPFSSRLPLF